VKRYLKKSVFNLNVPKQVEQALELVVQEVFMALELVSADQYAHTKSNFEDLFDMAGLGKNPVQVFRT
jgi:hypothetical protein